MAREDEKPLNTTEKRPLRFEMHADDLASVIPYFANRAVQGLAEGHRWSGTVDALSHDGALWGARTLSTDPDGVLRQSVYVLASQRGRGHLSRYVTSTDLPFVTAPDCDLERFFAKHGVSYLLAGSFCATPEYRAVERVYGERYAARSGLHYMNHVDEGLAVLRDLRASDRARRAWCLHPVVQEDSALAANLDALAGCTDDPAVMALAMEYRRVANAYLSRREVSSPSEVELGPLSEVADMLRADKVQNFKDFVLHQRATHPRADALERYFVTWLTRVGVSRGDFARWYVALQVGDGIQQCPDDLASYHGW